MHIILNIAHDTGLKVSQFLRSNPGTEAFFTYPFDNNYKKLLLEVLNIRGNDFLNYFIGKNIKSVTWDGDNVSSPTHDELFCSDFSNYLPDDTNYTAGDYDVYNSGVSVISKTGPLPNAHARYIIEFNKVPKAGESLNLFITFQGLANFTSLDSYLSSSVTGGDSSDINQYTDTTAVGYISPPLNTNTFTPLSESTYAYKPWAVSGYNTVMEVTCTPYTYGTMVHALTLPAGQYVLVTADSFDTTATELVVGTQNIASELTVTDINRKKSNSLITTFWLVNASRAFSSSILFYITYKNAAQQRVLPTECGFAMFKR